MDNILICNQPINLLRAKGLEVFYRKGYYGTSLEELLEKLGLEEKDFVEHFQNKEEFFIGVLQNLVFQRVLKFLIEPVSYKQSPFPLLLEVFEGALENAVANDEDKGSMLGNFVNEFNGKNPRISKYLHDVVKIWEINIISLLKKGKTDGYLNPHADCEAAAHFILASYFGTRTLMATGNKNTLKDHFSKQLRSYFYSLSMA